MEYYEHYICLMLKIEIICILHTCYVYVTFFDQKVLDTNHFTGIIFR